MEVDRPFTGVRISAETSASANLDDVCRWLMECQLNPLRLDVDDVPALGQGSQLRLALPVTARRAALCALWLLEDVDAGVCLLAGQLRFVAHPASPNIKLTFSGHVATAIRSGQFRHQAGHAARQLLEVIARSITRPAKLGRLTPAQM